MTRRTKIIALSIGSVVLAGGGLTLYALAAVNQTPEFYKEAISAKPEELRDASERMEQRATALAEDADTPGRWRSAFSADEVNGWLAVVLKEDYPDLLPPEVVDPRVAFVAGRAMVGYKYRGEKVQTLISVEAEAAMREDDVATVRFRRVRAGLLPLPTSSVIEYIDDIAKKLKVPVEWTEIDGDPLLIVPVANAMSTDEEQRRLDKVEFRQGEVMLMGSTEELVKPDADAATARAETSLRPAG